jgi:sarcosine oxidase subunit gamma
MPDHFRSRAVLRLKPESAPAASAAIGLNLSSPLNTAAGTMDYAALHLGPDEWLLLSTSPLPPLTLPEPFALVDVSQRQVGLTVTGPHATSTLNTGCPLDLHVSATPPGTATRTIFHKAEVVLWRLDDDTFHLEVWRSFVPYVTALLEVAAKENV